MKARDLYERKYREGVSREASEAARSRRSKFSRFLERHRTRRWDAAASLLQGGRRVLDVGCGDGELLDLLRARYTELCGIDIALSRAGHASSRLSSYPSCKHVIVVGDIDDRALPWPHSYFDAVVSLSVIEHVYDVFHFIEECHRVLAPGGQFIIHAGNIVYLKRRLSVVLGHLPVTSGAPREYWPRVGWDDGHLHYFDMASLSWLVQNAGFHVMGITGSGLLARLRRFWPSLLSGDLILHARKRT